MQKYYFEYTDTFGGELNYCWLRRCSVMADNVITAHAIVAEHLGLDVDIDEIDILSGNSVMAKNACVAFYDVTDSVIDRIDTQYDDNGRYELIEE